VAGFGNKANECSPGKDCEDEKKREAAGQFNGASSVVRIAVDNTSAAYSGNSLKVLYPKGTNTSSHSGAQFEMAIPGAVIYDRVTTAYNGVAKDELFLQYRVKFDDNFDFAQGGKLPGFLGSWGANTPDSDSEISARIMWRAEGRLEFYLHTKYDPRERLFWNNVNGTHAAVTRNKWHTIQMRMKLNTPGQADGIWQGYLDGVLVGDYRDLRFRNDARTNLHSVFFSTFHGGSSGDASSPSEIWWPNRDSTAWFDSFDVSTVLFK
jgi:hypothetical protein